LDGRGGERAPDVVGNGKLQRLSDDVLRRLLRDGVPGRGMPSFRVLGPLKIEAVAQYMRTLQGTSARGQLPGNVERGKALFFGKAACSTCHMIHGQGGFIGVDLSNYAATQSPAEVRSAITDPSRNLDPQRGAATVTTAGGKRVTGIARNEDNFSLQLQSVDGVFHLFMKSELQGVEQAQSLMPGDYGSRLTGDELDDLVSYLMNVGKEKRQSGRRVPRQQRARGNRDSSLRSE
jgi:putative heme-binding domain-containing protein